LYTDNELHILLAAHAAWRTKIDRLTVYIPEMMFCRMNSESAGLLLVSVFSEALKRGRWVREPIDVEE
jgi:hypothetical protein